MTRKNTTHALALVAVDLAAFALVLVATVLLPHPSLQLLAGALVGPVIGRLFILGHDACHQSFTPHRKLNRWLGRLVFMPSPTPYSLWDVGHNVVHHGYTDLRALISSGNLGRLTATSACPHGGSGWSTCTGAAGRQGCITRWKSGGSACTFRPGN